MKNKYFKQIEELIGTIQNIPYKDWAQLGADQLLEKLNNIKMLQKIKVKIK